MGALGFLSGSEFFLLGSGDNMSYLQGPDSVIAEGQVFCAVWGREGSGLRGWRGVEGTHLFLSLFFSFLLLLGLRDLQKAEATVTAQPEP